MKKRGYFFVGMLAILPAFLFAQEGAKSAQNGAKHYDFGALGGIEVAASAMSEAELDSSSTVSVITKEDIEKLNKESLADLLQAVNGLEFNSYGSLGALQNISIRGQGSSRSKIFIDGVLVNTAHDGTFDLSQIPVSIIERVEIVKSGTGSAGKANALGGSVYIYTIKADGAGDASGNKKLTLTFENGSFVPEKFIDANNNEKSNYLALLDSQQGSLMYKDNFENLSLVAYASGIRANNNYVYSYNDKKYQRENAGMWAVNGLASLSYKINDDSKISVQSFNSYNDLRVPGSVVYGLTPKNNQQEFASTSSIEYIAKNLFDSLLDLDITLSNNYAQLDYADYSYGEDLSCHKKNNASALLNEKFFLGDYINITSGQSFVWDNVDSTEIGLHNRFAGTAYLGLNAYLFDDFVSVHPFAKIDYSNDYGFAPSASLGSVFNLTENLSANLNLDYAYNAPTFSDLYWHDDVYMMYGNKDLLPETALSGELGFAWKSENINASVSAFAKDCKNLIAWEYDPATWVSNVKNVGHSFFAGTDVLFEIELPLGFSIGASYLFNYSWDLSANSFADDVRLSNVRMHTGKANLAWENEKLALSFDFDYLGKNQTASEIVLLDASLSYFINDAIKTYFAIDNILNASYEMQAGYPMHGLKLRTGIKVEL